MLTAWRIVTEKFVGNAFSGEGARLYGGRWNPKGVAVVYTAAHQSLAILEMLAQDQPLRARCVLIPVIIPDDIVIECIDQASLPQNWQSLAALMDMRGIGAEWLSRGSSAVLAVPSAILPDETNYLLNPAHPEFGKLVIGDARLIEVDTRLLAKFFAK